MKRTCVSTRSHAMPEKATEYPRGTRGVAATRLDEISARRPNGPREREELAEQRVPVLAQRGSTRVDERVGIEPQEESRRHALDLRGCSGIGPRDAAHKVDPRGSRGAAATRSPRNIHEVAAAPPRPLLRTITTAQASWSTPPSMFHRPLRPDDLYLSSLPMNLRLEKEPHHLSFVPSARYRTSSARLATSSRACFM